MKRYLFVFCTLMAYLLFCSKSCESPESDTVDNREIELTQIRDSIKNEFESEELTKTTLQAFEIKATEKLIDFSDFLNLYSDNEIDDTLKDQVRQMISELFISENVRMKISLSPEANKKGLKLSEFFMTEFTQDYDSINFRIDSINVLQPLRRKDELCYAGILGFSLTINGFSSSAVNFKQTQALKVEMMVVKVEKSFGADTLNVWKVFLGNME
jgi:hypothetical protein